MHPSDKTLMKSLLLFSTLFISTLSFGEPLTCGNKEGVQEYIELRATNIRENFQKQDVSDDVQKLEDTFRNCKIEPASFGWGKGVFKYWKDTGIKAELERISKQISHYANFREVDSEIPRYLEYAKKANFPLERFNALIDFHVKKGKESAVRERLSCGEKVDLRNDVLGDPRDQDTVGWCYAFAGADLLSYRLGQKISATDIAVIYNNFEKDRTGIKKDTIKEHELKGGFTDVALTHLKTKGACLEKSLPSEDNANGTLFENFAKLDSIKTNNNINADCSVCTRTMKSLYPGLEFSEYYDIMKYSQKAEYIKLLNDRACKPRIKLTDIKIKNLDPDEIGVNKVFAEINKQLDKKNILAVDYNQRLLYDVNTLENKRHESVIVGRRFNEKHGECEYLLRNSYGRSCSGYDKRLQKGNCEQGNIWMPKSVLIKDINDVIYLE